MKRNLPELPIEVIAIKRAALLVRALNHPFRQQMLRLMDEHEALTVTQLYEFLDELQPVVSSHLSVLREAGLVEVLPEGKTRWYSVNYSRLNHIHGAIGQLRPVQKLSVAHRAVES